MLAVLGLSFLLYLTAVHGYVEAVVGSYVAAPHFQPQVALLCTGSNNRHKYHNQYMDSSGHWITDYDTKAVCTRDKLQILDYCRKVYPKRDITNIVESSHYFRIEKWCKVGQKKCKGTHLVKPYRCLEGPFQSDALLVPEHCLFDHIHNESLCLGFDAWNQTASKSCTKRGMSLRSFAMLLPCGVDIFSGVEFVCCPHNKDGKVVTSKQHMVKLLKDTESKKTKTEEETSQLISDSLEDDLDDSDEDDSYEDDDVVATKDFGKTVTDKNQGADAGSSSSSSEENDDDADTIDDDLEDEDEDEDVVNSTEKDQDISNEDDDEDEDSDEDLDDLDNEMDEDVAQMQGTKKLRRTGRKEANPMKTTTAATFFTETTTTTTTETPTESTNNQDKYISHFDPKTEHNDFRAAERRLEEVHREKVTKVMKDWSELEERYQEMKLQDPKAADDFKKKITSNFQKTVAALEEEGAAEKHQLQALHQQRVLANINEKKRLAMECYTKALTTEPAKVPRIKKCLERLLRALEKDRAHTINHYKHLLNTNLEQANREKTQTLERLQDLQRSMNQSLAMLNRYPQLSAKIREPIMAFLADLQNHNGKTPYYLQSQDAESAMLEKYRADVAAKHQEHMRQKALQQQRRQQQQLTNRAFLSGDIYPKTLPPVTPISQHLEALQEGKVKESKNNAAVPPSSGASADFVTENLKSNINNMRPINSNVMNLAQPPKVAHAQSHKIHQEVMYSVKREYIANHRKSGPLYVTLAFAGVALLTLLIVGVAMIHRRQTRSPHAQGFIEVEQAATPEERHVMNMQVNGYENPTYKYFEAKD